MAGMSAAAADAIKRGFMALARASRPNVDYFALYRAKVLAQSQDRATVDVVPDDVRLPPMSLIPLKLGIPGATTSIEPGAGVLVGWENGDPTKPQAFLFDGGASVLVLSLTAEKIELGGEGLQLLADQLVVGRTPCAFTGAPHYVNGNLSTRVFAK
jgi:hypothetical protein